MQILDCTLRDGGYYNNWDFNDKLVDKYISCTNNLPIDYLEIGYRNPKLKGYFGKFYFCNLDVLKKFKNNSNKKISIMLNQKSVTVENIENILNPILGYVDLIRMAVDPNKVDDCILIAKKIKEYNIDIALNVMYASEWKDDNQVIEKIKSLEKYCKFLYLVDSFGSLFPEEVSLLMKKVKVNSTLGFHGHDNLGLGLSNTLSAIDSGAGIVDATITGMGRGAGNLSTELLLTVLNKKKNLLIDFDSLSDVVSDFEVMKNEYKWGTSLPYMFSGANSFPQKQVMDWITKRYYSFNAIVRTLDKQKSAINNKKYENYSPKNSSRVLLIGGGDSVSLHFVSILNFLYQNPNVVIVHSSYRNSKFFKKVKNKQIFCIAGNEGKRIEKNFHGSNEGHDFILAPSPREIDTYVPPNIVNKTYELESISFTSDYGSTHTGIALQVAKEMNAKTVFVVGYDGYSLKEITIKEVESFEENSILFNNFMKKTDIKLISLTKTKYRELTQDAIFNYIK